MKYFSKQAYLNIFALVGLGFILLLSFLYFLEVKRLNNQRLWIAHTQQTLEASYNIQKNIYLIESSNREFVLTGDEDLIKNFPTWVEAIYQYVDELKVLTRDNPDQQVRLDQLEKTLTQRIAIMHYVIGVRKTHNLTDTIQIIKSDPNILKNVKVYGQQIITFLQNIIHNERDLLKARLGAMIRAIELSATIGIIFISGSILIIITCLYLLNRQLAMRIKTENELKLSQEKLEHLAYFDYLTGLHNRSSLINYLDQQIKIAKEYQTHFAIFYFDLDNFKDINDNFGHEVGDKLLQNIASRLKNISKNNFVARISGDEFVLIMPKISNQTEVVMLAQEILDDITQPLVIDTQQIICTASIGICLYPQNATETVTVLKNADIALYKAKQLGKNNYQFCNQTIISEFEKQAQLQHELFQAVINKEFIVVYQPKMSLHTGNVSGVEALLRWNRPRVGLTYPTEFIMQAENNGLINPIGEWVLRTACAQLKQWEESGMVVPKIAINVSSREFILRDFSSIVVNVLNEMAVDPKKLEIEITESILLDKSSANINALQFLQSMGVTITIDDFGVGYSSLAYLSTLPIDKIKIDKSFVTRIDTSKKEAAIAEAIIHLAHTIDIKVTAEGVENQAQFDFLKNHACDEIQGFYYSEPLSSEELSKFIKAHSSQSFKKI